MLRVENIYFIEMIIFKTRLELKVLNQENFWSDFKFSIQAFFKLLNRGFPNILQIEKFVVVVGSVLKVDFIGRL